MTCGGALQKTLHALATAAQEGKKTTTPSHCRGHFEAGNFTATHYNLSIQRSTQAMQDTQRLPLQPGVNVSDLLWDLQLDPFFACAADFLCGLDGRLGLPGPKKRQKQVVSSARSTGAAPEVATANSSRRYSGYACLSAAFARLVCESRHLPHFEASRTHVLQATAAQRAAFLPT